MYELNAELYTHEESAQHSVQSFTALAYCSMAGTINKTGIKGMLFWEPSEP